MSRRVGKTELKTICMAALVILGFVLMISPEAFGRVFATVTVDDFAPEFALVGVVPAGEDWKQTAIQLSEDESAPASIESGVSYIIFANARDRADNNCPSPGSGIQKITLNVYDGSQKIMDVDLTYMGFAGGDPCGDWYHYRAPATRSFSPGKVYKFVFTATDIAGNTRQTTRWATTTVEITGQFYIGPSWNSLQPATKTSHHYLNSKTMYIRFIASSGAEHITDVEIRITHPPFEQWIDTVHLTKKSGTTWEGSYTFPHGGKFGVEGRVKGGGQEIRLMELTADTGAGAPTLSTTRLIGGLMILSAIGLYYYKRK